MDEKELLQEEESNVITFVDENGEESSFEYMDCIEYQGKEYLALLPVDEENENYLTVEDDAILDAVYSIFKERFKDVLTFED